MWCVSLERKCQIDLMSYDWRGGLVRESLHGGLKCFQSTSSGERKRGSRAFKTVNKKDGQSERRDRKPRYNSDPQASLVPPIRWLVREILPEADCGLL